LVDRESHNLKAASSNLAPATNAVKPKDKSMKNILIKTLLLASLAIPLAFIVPLVGTVALTGCASTNSTNSVTPPNPIIGALLSPANLQLGVASAASLVLALDPSAKPEFIIAKDLVCGEVAKGNVDPNAILDAVNQLGLTNAIANAAIRGGIFIYDEVFQAVSTNTTAKIDIYTAPLCNGLADALPLASARMSRKLPLHPH
jgi:hypothetical protein